MKERPILFSGSMVRAILAGQKTVTRRLVRGASSAAVAVTVGIPRVEATSVARFTGAAGDYVRPLCRCPYGAPGDRLWVRESWASADTMYQDYENDVPSVVAYRADHAGIQWSADPPRLIPDYDRNQWNWDVLSWKPSIHMPRWASRITLAVTDVHVERLHAIDDSDAIREGIPSAGDVRPFARFAQLWDAINGKRAPWSSKPVATRESAWDRNSFVRRVPIRVPLRCGW